ncbi:MAG TPA: HEAT repeat domain-containing protein [Bryobacteraceae bacterium]|nr:HEAT repeat domain-containing protein [Bryobacteraceae bacterium]
MFPGFIRALACVFCLATVVAAQDENAYNPNQRIQRIRELAKRDPQAIPALAGYLSDPNRDIRIEAVKAIVKLDTERSLEPLAKATHDKDSDVQIRATDGLVNYYVPGYVAKSGLTGYLTRGVRQVKAFFASRNDQVIDPDVMIRPDVAQALAEEIGAAEGTDARANAARAAGILRDSAAVPALLQALHSKDNETLFETLVALQKIDDAAAAPGILFLTHDLDDRIQATALQTVGILHSIEAAQDVRSALAHARSDRVRRAALEALAMLGMPADRATFQGYLKDNDPELRASALEGLGRIRDPEDTPALNDAYNEKDADWRVHLAAAFALVDEGKVDTSEFSPLPYLVENLDVKGRANVAQPYLSELVQRDEVRKALFPLVAAATRDQKIALCAVFSASHNPDVIPVLNTLSKDIDPAVSLAAARSLRIVQARKLS